MKAFLSIDLIWVFDAFSEMSGEKRRGTAQRLIRPTMGPNSVGLSEGGRFMDGSYKAQRIKIKADFSSF